LIDESGVLMAPLVRRTWAPRGQTPHLDQSGGQRQKVSVAAALWLPPRRDRLSLSFATLVNGYFDNWQSAAFLEALLQELTGRVVVVWDGGSMHKGDAIHELAERCADRLSLEKFPPYAPILNPVEPVWSWLKYGRLCNFASRRHRIGPGDRRRTDVDSERPRNAAELLSCFRASVAACITYLSSYKHASGIQCGFSCRRH